MNLFQKLLRKAESRLLTPIRATRAKRLTCNQLFAQKYKRIYHYHIRKTAGTSLNSAFLGIVGADLRDVAQRNYFVRNNLVFVQHDKKLIARGEYFYAASHFSAYELDLPEKTFTITILRDPLDRLLSQYAHLMWVRDDPEAVRLEPARWVLRRESKWLGNRFADFAHQMPKSRLLNQLYMFSESFTVAEAVERIVSCNYVGFTADFAANVQELATILDLPLQLHWERRFGSKPKPPAEDLAIARAMLEPEYELLRLVQARLQHADRTRVVSLPGGSVPTPAGTTGGVEGGTLVPQVR